MLGSRWNELVFWPIGKTKSETTAIRVLLHIYILWWLTHLAAGNALFGPCSTSAVDNIFIDVFVYVPCFVLSLALASGLGVYAGLLVEQSCCKYDGNDTTGRQIDGVDNVGLLQSDNDEINH